MPNYQISAATGGQTPDQQPCRKRRGAVLPLIAILLPMLLIMSSFVVNLAYMELTRTELRIASDAATRAAGFTLIDTGDRDAALAAARKATQKNKVAGVATKLRKRDVVFGVATRDSVSSRYTFTSGGSKVNAVRVLARRDSSSRTGAVRMLIPTFGAVTEFGPQQLAISSQAELDIALVLDRSGSMAYGDQEDSDARAAQGLGPEVAPPDWHYGDAAPVGSRWLDLVAGVNVFFQELQSSPQVEHVSLVTYASNSLAEENLSNDYSLVPAAMDTYTQSLQGGATNIGSGIYTGVDVLRRATARPWAVKVIVLMTDGRHNTGEGPVAAAQFAARQGITVYAITFSQDADQSLMEQVADDGGGLHFHADDSAALATAFRKIAKSLPSLLVQ